MWWTVLACAPRPPSAHLHEVALVGLGWEQASAEVRIAVDNPLPVEVPVTGLAWSLEVAGRPLLTGTTPAPPLAAGAVTVVPIPVELRYADLVQALGADADDVPYQLAVAVDLDTPMGPVRLPLAHAGTLPDLEPPTVDLVSVDLDLDGTVAVMALDLAVGLPSWIGSGTLEWRLTAPPNALAGGSAALTERRMALVAEIDPAAFAATLADSWRGGTSVLRVDLEGRLATSLGELPIALSRELHTFGPDQ